MWVFMFYWHASFSSGCKRVRELKWASKSRTANMEISLSSKKRDDPSLCTLMLCSDRLCSNTFDTAKQVYNLFW